MQDMPDGKKTSYAKSNLLVNAQIPNCYYLMMKGDDKSLMIITMFSQTLLSYFFFHIITNAYY